MTAGVIGSVLLLLRNSLSFPLYVVSLAGVIVQDVYVFGMTDSVDLFGMAPVIMQTIVFLFAAFLVWYSGRQKSLGILR